MVEAHFSVQSNAACHIIIGSDDSIIYLPPIEGCRSQPNEVSSNPAKARLNLNLFSLSKDCGEESGPSYSRDAIHREDSDVLKYFVSTLNRALECLGSIVLIAVQSYLGVS